MSGREGVRLSTMRSDEGKIGRCLAPEVAVDCLDVNGGELSGLWGQLSDYIIWSPLRSLGDDGAGGRVPIPGSIRSRGRVGEQAARTPWPCPAPARPPRPKWRPR
jgi:hypothetical protein